MYREPEIILANLEVRQKDKWHCLQESERRIQRRSKREGGEKGLLDNQENSDLNLKNAQEQ